MASTRPGVVPMPEEFESLQFRFGFMPEHGVQFSSEGFTIYQPPVRKMGIIVAIFEARFRLTVSGFFDEVMREYDFSIHDLTPNAVRLFALAGSSSLMFARSYELLEN